MVVTILSIKCIFTSREQLIYAMKDKNWFWFLSLFRSLRQLLKVGKVFKDHSESFQRKFWGKITYDSGSLFDEWNPLFLSENCIWSLILSFGKKKAVVEKKIRLAGLTKQWANFEQASNKILWPSMNNFPNYDLQHKDCLCCPLRYKDEKEKFKTCFLNSIWAWSLVQHSLLNWTGKNDPISCC